MSCTSCGEIIPAIGSDLPCPRCGSVDRNLTVADYGAAAESAFVDGLGGDGSETIRVARGGSDGRVASADATPDGKIADRIEGRASHKDHAEFRVAANLVSRLNQLGANWRSPELLRADAREERGVDCIAHDGAGNKLLIQVTTTDQDAWGQLARDSLVVRGVTSVAVVEAIRAAIAHKATRAAPDVVLALDATDSPRAAFRSVADSFRDQHGRWAASIGFREIWLVGPVVGLVQRLC